jgi:hypothetical protein
VSGQHNPQGDRLRLRFEEKCHLALLWLSLPALGAAVLRSFRAFSCVLNVATAPARTASAGAARPCRPPRLGPLLPVQNDCQLCARFAPLAESGTELTTGLLPRLK